MGGEGWEGVWRGMWGQGGYYVRRRIQAARDGGGGLVDVVVDGDGINAEALKTAGAVQ